MGQDLRQRISTATRNAHLLVCVVANKKVCGIEPRGIEKASKNIRGKGSRQASAATAISSSPVSLRSSAATTFEVACLMAWSFAKDGTPAAMEVEGTFVRQ